MKKLLVFFTALLAGGAARADIQSALGGLGSGNQTSFQNNQGIVNNNQYNQMTNPNRVSGAAPGAATANFGNCDALMQRCASPKCGNGGCTDMNIAYPIVLGCVNASAECKKHGDALAQSVAAQMVASNIQKTNAANAAQQQQMAQQQSAQSAQQLEQMNAQMAAMQQQMAQQQQASQQQMQEMMAQQAAQQQAALAQQAELLKQQQPAPTPAAAPVSQAAAAVPATPVQQSIDSGVSADAIARNQIVGQVLTSLDGVDASIKSLEQTVREVLDYAKCDYNANSCEGPRRVAAFRKKAQNFFEPYDGVLDALENSLYTAMAAGIDVSDIYMMLTNSCTQWGKYLCQPYARPVYQPGGGATTYEQVPNVFSYCSDKTYKEPNMVDTVQHCVDYEDASHKFKVQNPRCTFVEMYRNDQRDEVQQNYILANSEDATNIRMACMSDGLLQSGIFARRNRRKSNDFDIDTLEVIINQEEPRNSNANADSSQSYCKLENADKLRNMISTKKYTQLIGNATPDDDNGSILTLNYNIDCWEAESGGCYANPMFAMCSVHAYNSGQSDNDLADQKRKDMNEIIALKSTVIAQQLKKQKDYLASIVKQIKTQMQKSVLAAKAEAAGAQSGRNSSSGAASAIDCGGKRGQDLISCISNARSAMQSMSQTDFRKACESIALAFSSAAITITPYGYQAPSAGSETPVNAGIGLCKDLTQGGRQIQMSLIDQGVTLLADKEREASRPIYR